MNILIVGKHYGLINGASICTYELVSRWCSLVERIDIICSQKWYQPDGISPSKNIFIHPLLTFNPTQVRAKCKELVTENTVIYSAEDYGVFGKLRGVPYVLTYHGNWPQALGVSLAYFFKGLFHIPMYILNFKLADAVVCINQFSLPWVALFTHKVKIIKNGIRLKSENFCPPIANPSIITVARIDERKGKLLVEVIQILLELAQQLPWHLYIVGPIAYEPLRQLVDNQRIFSLGFVSNVADYVQKADVFILASSMELEPLAIIEAMALSKPVVCFDVGGISQITSNETGVLVSPFNIKKFAQSILDLLYDKEQRDEKGRKAKELVKDFDWDKSALQYLNLFRELI